MQAFVWPLACEISVGCASMHGHPRCALWILGVAEQYELCTRATAGTVSGVRTITWLCSRIVSVAEVDKRRAALGGYG